jgi:hypothetical protein
VPFALDLTLGNRGERANAAEPDVVDPFSSLGDCGQQTIASVLFSGVSRRLGVIPA